MQQDRSTPLGTGLLHQFLRELLLINLSLWMSNRSSTGGDLGIFADQSVKPVVASEAKAGLIRPMIAGRDGHRVVTCVVGRVVSRLT